MDPAGEFTLHMDQVSGFDFRVRFEVIPQTQAASEFYQGNRICKDPSYLQRARESYAAAAAKVRPRKPSAKR
ncbi:MAG TPA: hypothetical protein VF331_05215 [Polyangiales bacterium]